MAPAISRSGGVQFPKHGDITTGRTKILTGKNLATVGRKARIQTFLAERGCRARRRPKRLLLLTTILPWRCTAQPFCPLGQRWFDAIRRRKKMVLVTKSFQPRLAGLLGIQGHSRILVEKNLADYRKSVDDSSGLSRAPMDMQNAPEIGQSAGV
jgi:hypothetical protein